MKTFQPLGVAAIGANCGTTFENMEKILGEYRTADAGLALWAKPNAGLPSVDPLTGRASFAVTPEQMGAAALINIQLGAQIVGGCCGSTPAHVAAIAQAVRAAGR